MNIQLPPTNTTGQFSIRNLKVAVFIGANGSGKSRLGTYLEQNNPVTHRISAQKVLSMPGHVSPSSYKMAEDNFLLGQYNENNNQSASWLKMHRRWSGDPDTRMLNDID